MSYLADYSHPGPIRAVLVSLVPVVCPPQAIELGLTNDIVDHVELSMRASPAGVRAALLAGISGYEVAAMAYPAHRGARASQLARASSRLFRIVDALEAHAAARVCQGHQSLICLSCYEQPAMMQAIGYTPQEWIDKSIRYRLTTYADAITRREADIIKPDPLANVQPKNARSL